MYKPERRKKSYELEKYLYYVEWNPRAENVLERMAKKEDHNRIIRIKFVGSGQFAAEMKKQKHSTFFRRSFKKVLRPMRFKDTVIDCKKNFGRPIPIWDIQEEFNEFVKNFDDEIAKTVTADEVIWVDNLDNEDWGNPGQKRWMGWMSRDILKMKGDYRKAIPDLYESGVYRPLVLANVIRHDLHRACPMRIKRKRWQAADRIRFADVAGFLVNLWVDRGDIEAFLIDPKTREAVRTEIPVSAKVDGQRIKFE